MVFGTSARRSGVRAPCAEWHLSCASAEYHHRQRIVAGTRGHLLEVPADGDRIWGAAGMYTSMVGSVSLVRCASLSARAHQCRDGIAVAPRQVAARATSYWCRQTVDIFDLQSYIVREGNALLEFKAEHMQLCGTNDLLAFNNQRAGASHTQR